MITGSIVALITPMNPDGSIDWESLDRLVEFHISAGTDAIVAVGTTGESATLNPQEHIAAIERVVKTSAGRRPVIAGTGANNTAEAIELTAEAKRVGADACLLVTPYYNKPPHINRGTTRNVGQPLRNIHRIGNRLVVFYQAALRGAHCRN